MSTIPNCPNVACHPDRPDLTVAADRCDYCAELYVAAKLRSGYVVTITPIIQVS